MGLELGIGVPRSQEGDPERDRRRVCLERRVNPTLGTGGGAPYFG